MCFPSERADCNNSKLSKMSVIAQQQRFSLLKYANQAPYDVTDYTQTACLLF